MNLQSFLRLLLRRWWVILLVTAMAVGGVLAYSWRQLKVYEASATVQIYPAPGLTTQQVLDQLSLLSYGSVINSIVIMAESRSTLGQAATRLNAVSPDQLGRYTVVATKLPDSTVLNLAVSGPDRASVTRLANSLSTSVVQAASSRFPTAALSPLDRASTSTQTRPKTGQNVLYGGLAGLIVGFVIAGLSTYRPTRVAEPSNASLRAPLDSGTDEGRRSTGVPVDIDSPAGRLR